VSTALWASGEPTEAAITGAETPATTGNLLAVDPSDGNSSLLFCAWDEASGKFFLQGLPLTMDGLLGSATADHQYNLTGLSTFFSGIGSANWGVIAADNFGSEFEGYRVFASVPSTTSLTADGFGDKNNFVAKAAAEYLDLYLNRSISAGYANGPWPLMVTDPEHVNTINPNETLGLDLGGNGMVETTGSLVDGAQLFAWLLENTTPELIDPTTFTQYGNWTLSLTNNTLTYSDATFEFAKLGATGWFDSKASTPSWYVAEFEDVAVPADATISESYAYVNGVREDTLINIENLVGGSNNDSLGGDAKDNRLEGNGGNDLLIGAAGNDVLVGGAGDDSFRFDAILDGTTNVDTVSDFDGAGTGGGDVIELDQLIFTELTPTTVLSTVFESGTADVATASTTRLIYNSTSGALFYDQDGSDGLYSPIQFATLATHPAALAAGDFLVV
jgi:Ca2+-binding RTX toxin-like protein